MQRTLKPLIWFPSASAASVFQRIALVNQLRILKTAASLGRVRCYNLLWYSNSIRVASLRPVAVFIAQRGEVQQGRKRKEAP